MFILFFIISVFTIYLDYSAHKDISSPVIVFTSLWLFICTLASLRLYGFTGYSEKTIGYITCGSVAFSLGAFSSTLVNKQAVKQTRYASLHGKTLQTSDSNQQQLCFTFLEIILALACVGSALSFFSSLNALRSGASYMEVRGSRLGYNDEQVFSNPIVGLFVTYFCGPAMTVLTPVAIIFLFKKQHRKFSLIVFLCVLMNTVSSGGRIQIIYIALQLVAAFLYYRRAISAKTKRTVTIAVIAGIIALFILTSLRTNQNFSQSIYTYFTLPVGLFSYYTSIVDINNFESFGAATFYPPFYVLASVATFLEPRRRFWII
ncbi:MAG: O-antigen polymerase [Bifidobacterium pseudocatenulatum]